MPASTVVNPELLRRVLGEYREMPGLALTAGQARRLWQLDATTCEAVLHLLVAEGFLERSPAGTYRCAQAPPRFASRRQR